MIRILNRNLLRRIQPSRFNTNVAIKDQEIINYAETQVTELKNGLRVATENMGLNTTTVGLWIDCGTRYERLHEMGTAHFFEHLVFKGSPKMNKSQLETYAEDSGSLMNAYTSREQTAYYFQGTQDNTDKLIELLADMVQNPTLAGHAIKMERYVINAEYADILANPQEVIFDYIHAFCFGGIEGKYLDSSLSYNILGSKYHISKLITQEKIKDFINIHYHPSRMILVATGGVDHDHVVALANKYFTRNDKYIGPGTPTFERDVPKLDNDIYANFWKATEFQSCEIRQSYNQGHSTVSGSIVFPTYGWSHSDSMTMMLVSQIIGIFAPGDGGSIFSAPPLTKVLQALDQQCSFQSYSTLYNDTGLFGVVFTTFRPEITPQIIDVIQSEIRRIAFDLSDDELELAKKGLLPNIALQLDGSQPVADEIGRQLLIYGRRIHYPEIEALVNSVTKEDITRCLTELIDSNQKALCLIGDLTNVPSIFPDVPQITNPEKIHEDYYCKYIEKR